MKYTTISVKRDFIPILLRFEDKFNDPITCPNCNRMVSITESLQPIGVATGIFEYYHREGVGGCHRPFYLRVNDDPISGITKCVFGFCGNEAQLISFSLEDNAVKTADYQCCACNRITRRHIMQKPYIRSASDLL